MKENKISNNSILILMIIISLTYGIVTYVKWQQYGKWKLNPNVNYANNIPLLTTTDGYYWTRYAKYINQGKYIPRGKDILRYYPELWGRFPKPTPLISQTIAYIQQTLNIDYYTAGILMVIFFSGLFIVPLIIYFYNLNLPATAVLGSLIGAFSWSYFTRTSVGRVDTDALNLFFLFSASLFILFAYNSKKYIMTYIYSAISGLVLAGFYLWYHKPLFMNIYFVILLLMLIVKYKMKVWHVIISLGLFVLFCNPIWFNEGLKYSSHTVFKYLPFLKSAFAAEFPDIFHTITEVQEKDSSKILSAILHQNFISLFGLIMTLPLIVFKNMKFVPLIPVFLLGLISFVSSNRFAMYLAPFVGIGLGYLIDILINYLKEKTEFKYLDYIPIVAAYLLFVLFIPFTAYSYMPKPIIPANVFKSFYKLSDKIDNETALYSWWDFGYAFEDVLNVKTFHDPGHQTSPKTFFIAKSFVSDSQNEMYNIIKYLDNNGYRLILKLLRQGISFEDIIKIVTIANVKDKKKNKLILLFTQDMLFKYMAFDEIGNWFEDPGNKIKPGYTPVRCNGYKNWIFDCGKYKINGKTGLINNKIPLKKIIDIRNGQTIREHNYPYNSKLYFLLASTKNGVMPYLITEDVYKSNLNQMFMMGRYDKTKFKEILNDFPNARAFEVIR
jgi:dolichyl-diphosphooligosaccharide--protein glycosyltransferase